MKWRSGLYACCPYCSAKRVSGDTLTEYPFREHDRFKKGASHIIHKLAARRHRYSCGMVMIESERNHVQAKNVYISHYLVATHLCPAALVTFSKALTYIACHYDLSTLTSYETCELIAEQHANVTAKAIYSALRNDLVLQDNFRLPPIPLLDCHVKKLAKLSKKA